MAKQLITFDPIFDPILKTLDFTSYQSGFDFDRLYAVINVTQNTPIYIPGMSGYGASLLSPNIVQLVYSTTTHSSSDIINVYYDTSAGYETNTPVESGGQLQLIQEALNQLLVEVRITNILLLEHTHNNSLRSTDLQNLRNELLNPLSTLS